MSCLYKNCTNITQRTSVDVLRRHQPAEAKMKIVIIFVVFLVAVNAGAILPLNQIGKPLPTLQKIKFGRPIQTIHVLPHAQAINAIKRVHVIQNIPGGQRIKIQRLPVRRNILLQKPIQGLPPIRTVVKKGVSIYG